jgi:hypothetical protein
VEAPEVEELIAELEGAGVLEEAGKQGRALIGEAREAFSGLGFGAGGLLADLIDSIS